MKPAPFVIVIGLLILPSCVMENHGNGHYVFRAKTADECRQKAEMGRKAVDYATRSGPAPSLVGKTYKVRPSGRMMAAIVKFHPGGRLIFSKTRSSHHPCAIPKAFNA